MAGGNLVTGEDFACVCVFGTNKNNMKLYLYSLTKELKKKGNVQNERARLIYFDRAQTFPFK